VADHTSPRKTAKRFGLHIASPVLALTRPANVAMFHIGRVGSTVVTEMLGQHSRIDWAGEFHHRRSVKLWQSHLGEDDPIRRLRMRMALAGLQVFGYETKYIDGGDLDRLGLELEPYLESLKGLGYTRFILLERENLLRRFVSAKVGRERGGQWHTRKEANLTHIRLDLDNVVDGNLERPLLKWFERIEQNRRHLL